MSSDVAMDTQDMLLPIRSMFDAINARRQVRDMARLLGFGLSEQAAISLAAWTMADRLGFGATCNGDILVESVQCEARSGVRITCRSTNGFHALHPRDMESAGWMVDEIHMNDNNGSGIEVIMIKWIS